MSEFNQGEVLNNQQHDPLLNGTHKSARELMKRMAQAAHGFPRDAVELALICLLTNCVRQHAVTAGAAANIWDELSAKGKSFLVEHHYHSGHFGARRNVFPFAQQVDVPLMNVRPTVR